MIELIFRLPPCHVNEMTFASLLCVFLAVLLGCSYSQELKTRNWCNYNCVSCVVSWVARARKSHSFTSVVEPCNDLRGLKWPNNLGASISGTTRSSATSLVSKGSL